jgi:hypothetical protein
MKEFTFTHTLSPTQYAALVAQGKKAGWAEREVRAFLAERLRDAFDIVLDLRDLTPIEAGRMLNYSRFTIIRRFNEGVFRNAYLASARAIRIPRKDVIQFKESRRVCLQP